MRQLRPRLRRPSAPMAIAVAALFIALGGPAWAAGLIDGAGIRKGTVASKQVKDGSLRERDFARSTLRALTTVPNGAVGAEKLGDGAVTTRALAPGSVLSGTVGDNSLGAMDLAPNAAGADEVADNAVGQGEIRNNGVGTSEIADNTIDGGKVVDGSLSSRDLADNTIDGGKVVDGSLSIRDLARHVGTFEWHLDALKPFECREATIPLAGVDVDGALVIAAPGAGWPSGLSWVVNRTRVAQQLRVHACNLGLLSPAGTYDFNYAVLAF